MKKIEKEDVSYYAVDIEGSSYIHFLIKPGVKFTKQAIGDGFWMGKSDDLGNEFMVSEDSWSELYEEAQAYNDRDPDSNERDDEDEEEDEPRENIGMYLSEDLIEYVDDVVNNYYA